MGNCLVKPGEKNVSTPRSAKALEGDEAPKQLVVDLSQKKKLEAERADDDKNVIQVEVHPSCVKSLTL
jgi:hypothetical protein